MTIVELTRLIAWNRLSTIDDNPVVWVNYAPFVYYTSFDGVYYTEDDDTWIGIPAKTVVSYVASVLVDLTDELAKASSIATITSEPSFYWDAENRLLYVYLGGDPPEIHNILFGNLQGFSDRDVVNIDGVQYMPHVVSVPSVSQKQDLADYDQLAFVTGNIILSNASGDLDDLIDNVVYGNNVSIAYLDDDDIDDDDNASRSDLVYLASLYVEDYANGQRQTVLHVQDKRKAQDIDVPTETFDQTTYANLEDDLVGDVIPRAYGAIREMKAIPVTGAQTSGAVTFKLASKMTDLGDIYTLQDDVWTAVTPTATDTANGEFTLAEADARGASGAIFDCKAVDCIGVAITYASDVIKDLFDRYAGISYGSANYDTTEWAAEETSLAPIGIVFDESIKLYEAIRRVQAESSVGFRFEFLPSGLRTIRIDDWSRTTRWHIENLDIQNMTDITVDTDTSLIAAIFKVKYDKSYESGRFVGYTDETDSDTVFQKFRQRRTRTIETSLTSEAHAQLRSAYERERFTDIHGSCKIRLIGAEYLQARIYDTITIELAHGTFDIDSGTFDGEREFYSIMNAQIVGIDPMFSEKTNSVTILLTSRVWDDGRATDDDYDRITDDGATREVG